jgi:hypothetical protein
MKKPSINIARLLVEKLYTVEIKAKKRQASLTI